MGSGRNTPTKFYIQYLGEVLNQQVNSKTTSTPKPQGNQSVLELTREQNNSGFNLVSRTVQYTTISNPRVIQSPVTTAKPYFQVNASLPSVFTMEQSLPPTSHRVRFHPDVLDRNTYQIAGMPPTSVVPGILSTPSQIPRTIVNNVALNSVPIMSTTVSPHFPHTTTTTYTSYTDPLMGYSEEAIVKNIVNKNEQMGMLHSTANGTQTNFILGYNTQPQFATPQGMSFQRTTTQPTTNIPSVVSYSNPIQSTPNIFHHTNSPASATMTISTTSDTQPSLASAAFESPSIGNPFVTNALGADGVPVTIPNWQALAIHYHARSLNSKQGASRANYGRVPPPVLHLEKELRIATYQLWKVNWLDFFKRNNMPDSDGLSFLKEHSIPDQNLKNLIAITNSVESAFALLDTQFRDKAGEIRQLKRQICKLPMLPDNYDFELQLKVLRRILRYLTLFNRLFSPAEDLNVPELSDSMLSWIPKAQAMSAIRTYQKIMDDNSIHQGLPKSQTYYNILVHEIANLTTLNANKDAKKNLIGAAGFQTLNIVGEDLNVQAEYQVNYGQPKNNRLQISHNADPKKYTLMQRDQSGIKKQNEYTF